MALGNICALRIRSLLMLLIMAVIGVDQVLEFADLIFEMYDSGFSAVEISVCKDLISQLLERLRQ